MEKEKESPIFCVRRSSIIGRSNVVVDVYGDPGEEYQIQGSYPQRSCTIYSSTTCLESSSKEAMAEIKRKVDPSTHVMLGKDVFLLCLKPGFDSAFAMGLVLILDQMFDDTDMDVVDDENANPTPATQDNSS